MLKGNEYLRVWISRAGIQYLIHLPATQLKAHEATSKLKRRRSDGVREPQSVSC